MARHREIVDELGAGGGRSIADQRGMGPRGSSVGPVEHGDGAPPSMNGRGRRAALDDPDRKM
jgi:hypothetical protein